MSNRDDWENVADEIQGLGRARLVTELHNAFVAGQESIDEETPRKRIVELERALRQIREHEESRPVEYQSMHALFVIDEVLLESSQSKGTP